MASKYNPEIQHRRSIRFQDYDYAKEGLYFVTINCHERQCLFGTISDNVMQLNDAGKVAYQCWRDIPIHFPHVQLHPFVIMPDHVHSILEIIENPNSTKGRNEFQKIIPKSIGSIIRGFKIGVTKWFREHHPDDFPVGIPIWQRNYYEHIIRNEMAYHNIVKYIQDNPAKWEKK